MGKKRKSSARHEEATDGPNMDVGESRKRIRTFEDVADSEDEFHLNRDRILLDEGPEAKRRRKWQEQEELLEASDEEVLGYSEPGSGSEEEYEDAAEDAGQNGVEMSDASDAEPDIDEDEEGYGWGTTREDMYGADEIETEEQALEEEKEALRLQKKQLQALTAADYGFDEAEWQEDDAVDGVRRDDVQNVVTEVLPELKVDEKMGAAERLKLLKSRYPEFEPLRAEFLDLNKAYEKLLKTAQPPADGEMDAMSNAITKLRAATAYLAALSMYFALLSSPANEGPGAVAMSASQLRDHQVMESLVHCGELWRRAKDLPEDPKPTREEGPSTTRVNGHASAADGGALNGALTERPPKKSRAQKHAEAAQAADDSRRMQRLQQTEAGLADLDALIATSMMKKAAKSKRATMRDEDAGSDLGEEEPLNARKAAEKAKQKKSLRFYTSQIAQKANKRGTAGRNAGGDDDIPYRERLKDRQARLNAEAEKRGRRTKTDPAAELGGESDEEDHRQAQAIRGGEDEGYYDLIASRTAKKKADKAADAEAQRQADLHGGQVIEQEVVGADGKRKITYMIQKNKGLTPHRKKENRNPRVKKRKKYDEKKKKLASVKPMYKGGEGKGGYGGELTGIKKGLVKSTKL